MNGALPWYNHLGTEARFCVRAEYAKALGCPIDEVTDEMSDEADIAWMWATYRARIERFNSPRAAQ